jgi:hypothetical protein
MRIRAQLDLEDETNNSSPPVITFCIQHVLFNGRTLSKDEVCEF